ncbi:MAG TPA: sulfotransferase family protein [Cellvibrio sp.]|nr:sulfotransferase family protein [Cellvibrio sp.]
MSDYADHYSSLLSSPGQIGLCQQAQTLTDLLACIKQLWHCQHLDDDELLGEISRLNVTPVAIDSLRLAGHWLPYRYQPDKKQVNWLIPTGHATEPFQDETISRYRQQLFNQIIQPCTSVAFAQQQAEKLTDAIPSGFIFHLSRCGSTLISGCLSELNSTCVFSESPLLTALLLDAGLSPEQQGVLLRSFINLQAAAFPDRPQLVIKWNAWDIFRWELIRSVYPQVPAIFLVRDPVEILASHQRIAGWHMAGDTRLASIHPALASTNAAQSLLSRRSQVLAALLAEMNKYKKNLAVLSVDYSSLDAACIRAICQYFGIFPTQEWFVGMMRRLAFHSKMPGVVFADDSSAKQTQFSDLEKASIHALLMPLYKQFLNTDSGDFKKAMHES